MPPYTILITLLCVVALAALFYTLIITSRHVSRRKQYEANIAHALQYVTEKDQEMDTLFIQLLQWREFTSEYQKLIANLLPAIKNRNVEAIVAALDGRFRHLHRITETERKKYMAELTKRNGYSDDYQKLGDYLFNKLVGMDTVKKLEIAPF